MVNLNLEGASFEVGEMVLENRTIYFRYNPEFLSTGLNISPIKLPFSSEIASAKKEPFDGLFGVFNDSLPDDWGSLLLDRTLTTKAIDINQLSPLDRLAYVGGNGMGALSYSPKIEDLDGFRNLLELDTIAKETDTILKGFSSDIIEELFVLAGSSGGARPKIMVGYNRQSNELIHGNIDFPNGFEDWLIKFPSSYDSKEIAHIEYAYHKMAIKAGIEMSECGLLTGKSGQAYFGTKRFDRVKGKPIHMHTACGLMHDNFRMSTMDYGHLMDCAFSLEKHVAAYAKILRLAAFNVFAHNKDDHSKNFSFLMDAKGCWKLAPAYDLTYSTSAYGFHSTMIAGESKNPKKYHLLQLAQHYHVKNPEQIIEQVQEAIVNWDTIAKDCGVSAKVRKDISEQLNRI